jgi:galactonate dehydratase
MEGHKIATMAEAFFVSIAPHNPLSCLSTVICLHLDTVVPNFLIQEQIIRPEHKEILTTPADVVHGGYMEPPRGPGWGVELNEDFLRAHPYQEGRMFPLELAEDGSLIDL